MLADDGAVSVGAKLIPGAEVLFDGTRKMLDEKWVYWEGPGLKASMPIKWKIVEDPVGPGTVVSTDDPAAAGGNNGGKGITDTPGGLKLPAEGHDVRYRNIWIKELDRKEPNTDF